MKDNIISFPENYHEEKIKISKLPLFITIGVSLISFILFAIFGWKGWIFYLNFLEKSFEGMNEEFFIGILTFEYSCFIGLTVGVFLFFCEFILLESQYLEKFNRFDFEIFSKCFKDSLKTFIFVFVKGFLFTSAVFVVSFAISSFNSEEYLSGIINLSIFVVNRFLSFCISDILL